MKVESIQVPVTFKPFSVTLVIESKAEADALYQLGNFGSTATDAVYDETSSFDTGIMKNMLLEIYRAVKTHHPRKD